MTQAETAPTMSTPYIALVSLLTSDKSKVNAAASREIDIIAQTFASTTAKGHPDRAQPNYRHARQNVVEQRALELARQATRTPEIYLESAAIDDSYASFAIVDRGGRAVWSDRLPDNDPIWVPGDPSSAELSAALRAIWIAAKAQTAQTDTPARLHLNMVAADIDHTALLEMGILCNVAVGVEFSEDNAAVDIASAPPAPR
ncbi:hypothetical protein ACTXN7_11625 [Corynebacterium flavescens]|uniref:hypothetical protein n=1 Tax=Corynebacterium flavescens TaxID=28028 RepID=UPI003FD61180